MDQYIFSLQSSALPQLQIWHWQTDLHPVHVTLGELYDQVADCVDAIVEVWQGQTQTRIKVSGLDRIALVDWTDVDSAMDLISELVQMTAKQANDIKELDAFADVVNMLDELNAAFGKALYLLTLK